ncbi:MAG TPA: type II secretion system protein GspG [Bryobacteraceae bacterium]|nr:type II secretion system protein GspG [Bryobacteraceae bacterium]
MGKFVIRLVTYAIQLVALLLMLVSCFGDFRGRDLKPVAAQAQINAYITALKTYRKDTGSFPTAEQGLRALVHDPGVTRWQGPYVDKPISPDPWGRAYVYRYRMNQDPEIVSMGDDGVRSLVPTPESSYMESLPLTLFVVSAVTFFSLLFVPRILTK